MENKKVKEKILMIFFILVSMFYVQKTDAQESRLTMDRILAFLQSYNITPVTKAAVNKTLSREIVKNGMSFALDKETENILRQNGANDSLIFAIKKSITAKKSPATGKTAAKKLAAAEKPTNAAGYLKRAETCSQYDHDCRIKNYDLAIALDSQNAAAYKLRGDGFNLKSDFDRAVSDYTKAIEINPKFFDAYERRASAYHLKGEIEKAIGEYTKALEINPKSSYVYNQRGDLYRVYLGDYEKAIADLSKAIELEPDNVYFYEDRADAYRAADKYDLAIADYLKEFEIAKEPIRAVEATYQDLGECYAKTRQYQKAIDSYTKAIEIDSDYAGAYQGCAEMYEKIGEPEKAKADRKKYQELTDALWKRINKEN
jgi:tetratricopeptide (TPR) repeat protein